tara:strand:- start:168 stop:332 length:165 start_codon:yes stop_codon:yes gene_type:complete
MRKLELKENSNVFGGNSGLSSWCQALARRIDGQIAKGHLDRAERMLNRFERQCV